MTTFVSSYSAKRTFLMTSFMPTYTAKRIFLKSTYEISNDQFCVQLIRKENISNHHAVLWPALPQQNIATDQFCVPSSALRIIATEQFYGQTSSR